MVLLLCGWLYWSLSTGQVTSSAIGAASCSSRLIVSFISILSNEMHDCVTAIVTRPADLKAGKTCIRPRDSGAGRIDKNAKGSGVLRLGRSASGPGSTLADHTTYWENLDGFVLRVVRVCAQTAESPWRDTLLTASTANDKRSAWRVNFALLGEVVPTT